MLFVDIDLNFYLIYTYSRLKSIYLPYTGLGKCSGTVSNPNYPDKKYPISDFAVIYFINTINLLPG